MVDSSEIAFTEANAPSWRQNMPLLAALLQLKADGRLSFHMPGHRNGQSWPPWLAAALAELDTTELPIGVDLLRPQGAAQEAMDCASDYFGAAWTRFLTAGSTTGLLALLATCPGRRGRILMPAFCHQSVMHAAALLDLQIGWIVPSSSAGSEASDSSSKAKPGGLTGLLPRIEAGDVRAALKRYGHCDAVIITSPDYYGTCSDLAGIAAVCRQENMVFLVDEAHGAHLRAAPAGAPTGALYNGADACVQSAHKTMAALTPAAMLHVSADALGAGRLDCDRIEQMIRVFHTSSPSYAIAASLDYARYSLQSRGSALIQSLLDKLDATVHRLNPKFEHSFEPLRNPNAIPCWRDPTRLLIGFPHADYSTRMLADALQFEKIDVEMFDLKRLVLLPALDQPQEDLLRFTQVCNDWMDGRYMQFPAVRRSHEKAAEMDLLDRQMANYLSMPHELKASAGDLMFGNPSIRKVSWSSADGKISAGSVVPYPPGIPLIWPGEILTREKLAFLYRLSENGVSLTGFDGKTLPILS